MLSKSYSFW